MQEYAIGQKVQDIDTEAIGTVTLIDFDDTIEDYVYLVRFGDGSEQSYGDVALKSGR